jgi:hypothetical protein
LRLEYATEIDRLCCETKQELVTKAVCLDSNGVAFA